MEIFLAGVGKVILKKNARVKRMSIRMKPFTDITVHIPLNATYDMAKQFVFEKQNWIKKHLVAIQQQENKLTIFTHRVSFKTRKHSLLMEKWDKNLISVRVSRGIIMVRYPQDIAEESEQLQNMIRKGIEKALGIEANDYLPVRLNYLAKKLGFRYRDIKIDTPKTRWGACSNDNHISLNAHLMRLPSRLIDYVIIHELCHTKQKNHNGNFWQLMEKVLPGARLLDKEMKNYNTKIY